MIAIDRLSVEFGGVKALDAVTFSAQAGEIVGVVGPNGAGKSTLLDAICGFAKPAAGTISIDGVSLAGLRAHQIAARGVSRTHQAPRLFARMSALDNAVAGAFLRRASRPTLEREAREALAAAGFARPPETLAHTLDETERRRVEIARALMSSPRAMLLDEPFASFEQEEVSVLRDRLAAFAAEGKTAIVIAERDVARCAGLCKRAIVLHAGVKIAEGTPEAVAADIDVRDAYLGVEWRQ